MSLAKHTALLSQSLVRRWVQSPAWSACLIHTSSSLEAARKGTRAKAEAKKKSAKKEEIKREFIPLKKRLEMQQTGGRSPRRVEDHLPEPSDNVWFTKYYKWKVYNVCDAIAMHRETHHPSQIGLPDGLVNAYIELSLSADKKNRYLDNFFNVVRLPHDFDTEQSRSLIVVSKNEEMINYAREAGVSLAIGPEIVKLVQNGEINLLDYENIVADTELLPDLVPLRGLMKKRFPNVKAGTAGTNLVPIIDRFVKGIDYRTAKNKHHQDFGYIVAPFGRLSMTDEQLEENLASLISDVEKQRPQRKSDNLVTMVVVRSPPSVEQFKIDHSLYLQVEEKSKVAARA
ncbi:39S ribosomal protein L1, mitochondrial-like [Penaeus chinensis]|uniref:39S ribosomal protein L1, mitochondrial-like n=1 Tax=Penaeus chinensis TaxID=139456 RepID=UPI001FB83042|nr:39S ribosomal protein L1, mitochondrial-like [Penaeus chinensis]